MTFINTLYSGALYQEVVRQRTGKQLPFIIAVATKEKFSERALLQIPQNILDEKLQEIKEYLPRIQKLKQGKLQPEACNRCSYCISKKKTQGVVYYDTFFEERNK